MTTIRSKLLEVIPDVPLSSEQKSQYFKAMLSAKHSKKIKKHSYVDPMLTISEYQWLVSVSDQMVINDVFSHVKILIEGLMHKSRFLVEYSVAMNTDFQVSQIARRLLGSRRSGYSKYRTSSLLATPRECQALDSHLESLSDLLYEYKNRLLPDAVKKLLQVNTSLFSWCLDQIQKHVALR